jgi:hypothetical protein
MRKVVAALLVTAVAVVLLAAYDTHPPAMLNPNSALRRPAEKATPTPTATPKPQPPLVTPGKVTKLRFEEGDTIVFRVRADTTDHVHVHGYDLMKDIEPGKTITFSFPATITGIFEIELEDAGEEIAQLRVDPD